MKTEFVLRQIFSLFLTVTALTQFVLSKNYYQQRPDKNSNPICNQTPFKGNFCPGPQSNRHLTRRFTYSLKSGTCLPFIYKGCNGNSNNFASMQACISACRAAVSPQKIKHPNQFIGNTIGDDYAEQADINHRHMPSRCRLALDTGVSCDGSRRGYQFHMTKYGFDQTAGRCVSFNYYGCKGNSNRFDLISACTATCSTKRPTTTKRTTTTKKPFFTTKTTTKRPTTTTTIKPTTTIATKTEKAFTTTVPELIGEQAVEMLTISQENFQLQAGSAKKIEDNDALSKRCLMTINEADECDFMIRDKSTYSYDAVKGKCVQLPNFQGCPWATGNRFHGKEFCETACAKHIKNFKGEDVIKPTTKEDSSRSMMTAVTKSRYRLTRTTTTAVGMDDSALKGDSVVRYLDD